MGAVTMILVSLAVFAIGYRFYGLFIARTVLQLNPDRPTPAITMADGHDYVKTNRYVLFGHHVAANSSSRAAHWACACSAVWLSARCTVDFIRRGVCRCSA